MAGPSASEYNASLPPCPAAHPEYGTPERFYPYHAEDGRLIGFVFYFEVRGLAQAATLTMNGSGWHWASLPTPTPLYGLMELASKPRKTPVVLCLTEAAADACTTLLGSHAALAWHGGRHGVAKTDWGPLVGREVSIWPAVGQSPTEAAQEAARTLQGIAKSVRIIRPPSGTLEGWDATDCETPDDVPVALHPPLVAPAMPRSADEIVDPSTRVQRCIELGLNVNAKGEATADVDNAMLILENDKNVSSIVWYDEFLQKLMTGKHLPREWSDADDTSLQRYMQHMLGIRKMSKTTVADAVIAHARNNPKNCVKDWLDTLEWDSVPRIATFFHECYGANDNAYVKDVSRNFLISMVARVYKPGCKVDTMVVLEGDQGIGKSQSLHILGGEWFAEQHEAVTGKGFFEVLQGKWLIEIGELASMNRAEVTKVKQVISCQTDRFRVPWERHAADHPRQCTFVATTNTSDYNRDETGARRFWPIECHGTIKLDDIRRMREQLFAEAVALLKEGATWWQVEAEEAAEEQNARYIQDVWFDAVKEAVSASQSGISITDILTKKLEMKLSDQTRGDQMRVATILRKLGWNWSNVRDGKRVTKVWRKQELQL